MSNNHNQGGLPEAINAAIQAAVAANPFLNAEIDIVTATSFMIDGARIALQHTAAPDKVDEGLVDRMKQTIEAAWEGSLNTVEPDEAFIPKAATASARIAEESRREVVSHANALCDMLTKLERDTHELLRAIKAGQQVHERGVAASEALLSELFETRKSYLKWRETLTAS